jgi:parvulin-like peptidyl-prolyl isomerase
MNDTTTEARTPNNSSSKALWLTAGAIGAVVLAAGAYYLYGNNPSSGNQSVARVDGVEITQASYDQSTKQISAAYAAQGVDTASAEIAAAIKEQALNTLINRQLLLSVAEREGHQVDDAEVETEYQNVLAELGGEEGLQAALNETGITETTLRTDLRHDALINKYLRVKLGLEDLVVTDEEVETAYAAALETNASSTEALPPIEDVRELIRGQLVSEKSQALINTELERLRQEATIEILI